MNKPTARCSAVAVVMVCLLLSTGVFAGDAKRYTAAFCHFGTGDTGSKDRYPPKFQNRTGSDQRFVCPIIQEYVNYDVEYADIVAAATMDEDTCRFAMREEDGSYSAWLHDAVVATSANYNQTRWFSGASWLDVPPGAVFAISCILEDDSSVISYRFDDR